MKLKQRIRVVAEYAPDPERDDLFRASKREYLDCLKKIKLKIKIDDNPSQSLINKMSKL